MTTAATISTISERLARAMAPVTRATSWLDLSNDDDLYDNERRALEQIVAIVDAIDEHRDTFAGLHTRVDACKRLIALSHEITGPERPDVRAIYNALERLRTVWERDIRDDWETLVYSLD